MEVFSITFNGAAASVRNEPVRASKESALGSILLTGITHHLRKLRRAMSHFFRCSPFRLIPAIVALTTGAAAYYLGKTSSDDRKAEKKHKRAFLLLIQHEYKSIRDRDAFIELFKPLAKYVKQHEPETLAYELSVSDKDPHKLLVFERYSSREALTEIHQSSAPFKKFKEQWTAAKLEYTSKTGESYLEEDLGFM